MAPCWPLFLTFLVQDSLVVAVGLVVAMLLLVVGFMNIGQSWNLASLAQLFCLMWPYEFNLDQVVNEIIREEDECTWIMFKSRVVVHRAEMMMQR
jgi:hypothetical protein